MEGVRERVHVELEQVIEYLGLALLEKVLEGLAEAEEALSFRGDHVKLAKVLAVNLPEHVVDLFDLGVEEAKRSDEVCHAGEGDDPAGRINSTFSALLAHRVDGGRSGAAVLLDPLVPGKRHEYALDHLSENEKIVVVRRHPQILEQEIVRDHFDSLGLGLQELEVVDRLRIDADPEEVHPYLRPKRDGRSSLAKIIQDGIKSDLQTLLSKPDSLVCKPGFFFARACVCVGERDGGWGRG